MTKRGAQHRNRWPAPPRASSARQSSTPLLVEIEKPVYGGAFLARADGKAIFTPLTLPGEQARVRIVDDKRGYAFADADEILTASPARIAPLCPHFAACGGCDYQHADYEAQLAFKQAILHETLERAGVSPPAQIDVLAANPWAYRNRIRLAFDPAGNIGYRGRRSHALVPIRECPVAAPVLVKAALAAAGFYKVFAPQNRPTEISLFCDPGETAMLATIYTAGSASVPLKDYFAALVNEVPELRGVELVERDERGHPRTIAARHAASLAYRAAGFDYRVDHGAFFQVNRWLVDALIDRVTAARTGRLAWDLFAGVGLFARQLAANFDRVVAVESAPPAINALEANLTGISSTAVRSSTLDFLLANAKDENPDLIVVDPPRTGLGPEVTALLAKVAVPALTYVSCDPATLARDLKALIESGYVIERLTLADLFPQTFHLETVVDLRRA